jgi:epoxyqueuosine reductase
MEQNCDKPSIMEDMRAAERLDLNSLLAHLAPACDFDLYGVARIEDFPELATFSGWINEGRAGEMHYLSAQNNEGKLKRASVSAAAPWAKSAVVCAINYNAAAPFSTDPHPENAGWISRYAWFENRDCSRNTDYHDVVLSRLRTLERELVSRWSEPVRTWSYVDTGPIVERVLAKYAGIGWQGKNTCIINEEIGSYIFLGVILTSIELSTTHVNLPAADRCGSCTRCIEACPTQAITAPYQLDPRRCIAYLTIEKRGDIPEEFHDAIGRHVFGCDICQDVCPWNGSVSGERPQASDLRDFQPRVDLVNPDLNQLARLTPESLNEMFRRSPIKRTKYEGFMRNVAVALGNANTVEARASLEHLARSENPVISNHARRALEKKKSISE